MSPNPGDIPGSKGTGDGSDWYFSCWNAIGALDQGVGDRRNWAENQVLLQVFTMRSMASGAAFHRAYHRATQQAFLDAHEHAFRYFQGVFTVLRYDNLKAAVKKILRGYRREETARFIAFRSHWRFSSEFGSPYEAHEKGGIESEAGYFRRNHWVPVPKARDFDDLNAQLVAVEDRDGFPRDGDGRFRVQSDGWFLIEDNLAYQHSLFIRAPPIGSVFRRVQSLSR